MKPITVKSVGDVPEKIEPGQAFFVDVWPVEPVTEADEIVRLEQLDAEIHAAIGSAVTESTEPAERFAVEWSDTHVTITATDDITVELGGDVRDGTAKLRAGRPSKRKLEKRREGWISIDGQRSVSYTHLTLPTKA